MFRTSSMTLPMYIEAMRPHTKSGFLVKSRGPGCRLNNVSMPSSTAVVPDPGMPSVSSGIMAPPVDELFAASGEATPAIMPVSYTHLRAHETPEHLVCRLLLEK